MDVQLACDQYNDRGKELEGVGHQPNDIRKSRPDNRKYTQALVRRGTVQRVPHHINEKSCCQHALETPKGMKLAVPSRIPFHSLEIVLDRVLFVPASAADALACRACAASSGVVRCGALAAGSAWVLCEAAPVVLREVSGLALALSATKPPPLVCPGLTTFRYPNYRYAAMLTPGISGPLGSIDPPPAYRLLNPWHHLLESLEHSEGQSSFESCSDLSESYHCLLRPPQTFHCRCVESAPLRLLVLSGVSDDEQGLVSGAQAAFYPGFGRLSKFIVQRSLERSRARFASECPQDRLTR